MFLKVTSAGLRTINETELLDTSTAIVGVSQSHWIKHLPQNVRVDWNLLNNRINRVPYTVTDPAGPLPGFLMKGDTTIEWKNFLRTYKEPKLSPIKLHDGRTFPVPVVSLLLLFICLTLAAIAFGSKRLLAIVLGGLSVACLLTAVLMMRVAIIQIKNPIPGPPTEAAAIQITTSILANARYAFANWTVLANARHWGHVDQRTISYKALMDLTKVKGIWKLAGLTILDVKSVN